MRLTNCGGLLLCSQGTMTGGHYFAYVLSDRVRPRTAVPKRKTSSPLLSSLSPSASTSSTSKARRAGHSRHASVASVKGGDASEVEGSGFRRVSTDITLAAAVNDKLTLTDSHSAPISPVIDGNEVAPSPTLSSTQQHSQTGATAASSWSGGDSRRWVYCSDASVRFAPEEEVFSSKPYMLFYERISPVTTNSNSVRS